MKTSFSKKDKEAVEASEDKALAVAESKSPAITNRNAGVDGEFKASDFLIPRINLVGKTGNLSNNFQPGSFVFNKELVVGSKDSAMEAVITHIQKKYIQEIPYGTDVIPKIFASQAEVEAAGGTLDISESEDVDRYIPFLVLTLLVAEPKEKNPAFSLEGPDKKNYALAQYNLTKSAYRGAGRQLLTDSQTVLRGGLTKGRYQVSSKLNTNTMGSWFTPTFKLAGTNNDEFQAWASSLI
jgi:hypothetical protein